MRRYGGVAIVGDGVDGITDAGIEIGHGLDITKETGDIILLRDRLDQLIDLVELSKKAINNVRLNLIYVSTTIPSQYQ